MALIEPNSMCQANPGQQPAVHVFHNKIGNEGVCGLCVLRQDEPPEVACMLVRLDEHTQKIMHRYAEHGELYETATSLLALYALRLGDIAIDIGAHVGFYTVLSRLAVGRSGAVYAFEPSPDTFRRLRNNVFYNKFENVFPLPFALSDQVGSAVLYVNKENEGESSLLANPEGKACRVEATTLDEYFSNGFSLRPRLMKIDVEGFEMNLLSGAEVFFSHSAPDMVVCEMNKLALARYDMTEFDLREFFVARGYRCAVVNNSTIQEAGQPRFYRYLNVQEKSSAQDYRYVYNLMFIREGSGLYPDAMI